jgi:hypothetical protein
MRKAHYRYQYLPLLRLHMHVISCERHFSYQYVYAGFENKNATSNSEYAGLGYLLTLPLPMAFFISIYGLSFPECFQHQVARLQTNIRYPQNREPHKTTNDDNMLPTSILNKAVTAIFQRMTSSGGSVHGKSMPTQASPATPMSCVPSIPVIFSNRIKSSSSTCAVGNVCTAPKTDSLDRSVSRRPIAAALGFEHAPSM